MLVSKGSHCLWASEHAISSIVSKRWKFWWPEKDPILHFGPLRPVLTCRLPNYGEGSWNLWGRVYHQFSIWRPISRGTALDIPYLAIEYGTVRYVPQRQSSLKLVRRPTWVTSQRLGLIYTAVLVWQATYTFIYPWIERLVSPDDSLPILFTLPENTQNGRPGGCCLRLHYRHR